ncbi:NAD(P)-binding domain-containing protein [Rhizobium lusitanum]|uniref:NADPH-dependent F420 reductase n=1 Tax=Rhizobium lusitanum TaxID=293958 RepID=UPI0019566971|nr:NAD(P)-binding domain-containing protein [Rhizobium lusitanum]
MKVGILGAGHIGKTLVRELSRTGYDVKVANSRGPETIDASIFASGGRAVTIEQAVEDADILILSIPLNRLPEIAPKIAALPEDTVVIDTSNYYPMRDTKIADIEAGEVESVWVSRQLGRPVVKAWNAIGSDSFARLGKPAGHPDRIAIPVAADNERDRRVAMALVGDTGFDAVDAGPLSESWRQQPGAPVYCTDLTAIEMPDALASTERSRLPQRRDLSVAAVQERLGDKKSNPDADFLVRLNRALFL